MKNSALGLPLAMQAQEHSNAERRIREVEIYRQKRMTNEDDNSEPECNGKTSETEATKPDAPDVDTEASSSTGNESQKPRKDSDGSKSPKPDVVSSTLSPKDSNLGKMESNLSSQLESNLSKGMQMLTQIFPAKNPKVLEIKLKEAKGDVVKALGKH